MQQGAHEPLFGVATGAMKPIAKKIKTNQAFLYEFFRPQFIFALASLFVLIATPRTLFRIFFLKYL
jgi:hypothetical protein